MSNYLILAILIILLFFISEDSEINKQFLQNSTFLLVAFGGLVYCIYSGINCLIPVGLIVLWLFKNRTVKNRVIQNLKYGPLAPYVGRFVEGFEVPPPEQPIPQPGPENPVQEQVPVPEQPQGPAPYEYENPFAGTGLDDPTPFNPDQAAVGGGPSSGLGEEEDPVNVDAQMTAQGTALPVEQRPQPEHVPDFANLPDLPGSGNQDPTLNIQSFLDELEQSGGVGDRSSGVGDRSGGVGDRSSGVGEGQQRPPPPLPEQGQERNPSPIDALGADIQSIISGL